jgi:hypothetical protein
MPRVYSVEFQAQTITATNDDHDLFEFDAAAEKPIELVGFEIGNASNTDVGDAQEEMIQVRVIRGHTTSGNGTSTTPRPVSPNDTAAGFAAETVGSTVASAGTGVNLMSTTFNPRVGYAWGPVPNGMGLWTAGTELLVVRIADVADDITLSGTAWIIEYP